MASLILVSNSSCVGRARFSKICDTRVSAMSSAATSAPAGSSNSSVTSSAPRSGVHQVWPSRLRSPASALLSMRCSTSWPEIWNTVAGAAWRYRRSTALPGNCRTTIPSRRPWAPSAETLMAATWPPPAPGRHCRWCQVGAGGRGGGKADKFAGACVRDGGPDFLLLQRAQTDPGRNRDCAHMARLDMRHTLVGAGGLHPAVHLLHLRYRRGLGGRWGAVLARAATARQEGGRQGAQHAHAGHKPGIFHFSSSLSKVVGCSRCAKHVTRRHASVRMLLRQGLERPLDAVADLYLRRQRLERCCGLLVVVAQSQQGLQDIRLRAADCGAMAGAQVRAQLSLEFQQQSLGSSFANARHLDKAGRLLPCNRLGQIRHAHAGKYRQRHARPQPRYLDQRAKRLALRRICKAIQQLVVLAHDELREHSDPLAHGGQIIKAAHRHIHLLAHAVAVEQHLGGIFLQQSAGQFAYHCCPLSAPAQTATAPSCHVRCLTGIISVILRHPFPPHDNTRLTQLCVPADAHLRSIEAALQVRMAHRHEQFKIEGPKARAMQAMQLLQALYEMAERPIAEDTLQLMLAADQALVAAPEGAIMLSTRRADLRARTPTQSLYLQNIANHDITLGIGPAGTGKTFLAVACAVDALERSAVQRIVLTRPAVEAGERLGFLPGDLAQKVDPYLRPLYDALYELMGYDKVQKAFERNALEIAPLAFMRGRTLNNAFVILDEAQNTTPEQMKMFLTRIGFGAKAVVTGDVSQIDLPPGALSGLIEAEQVLKRVQGIALTRFTSADVVRHPLVARIVDAYDAPRRAPSARS